MSNKIIFDPASFDALQRVIEYSREEAARLDLEMVCILLEMAKTAVDNAILDHHHTKFYDSNESLMRQH